MLIKSVNGISPSIPSDCYIAENADSWCSNFGKSCGLVCAVIRGDVNSIHIGNKS
jgi:carbonic anhydrase/acetyltransferase-like protein (isoleucine patch superfamily)